MAVCILYKLISREYILVTAVTICLYVQFKYVLESHVIDVYNDIMRYILHLHSGDLHTAQL